MVQKVCLYFENSSFLSWPSSLLLLVSFHVKGSYLCVKKKILSLSNHEKR